MQNEAEEIKKLAEWFADFLTPDDRKFLSKLEKADSKSLSGRLRTYFSLSPMPGLTRDEASRKMYNYYSKLSLLCEKVIEVFGQDAPTEKEQDEIIEDILDETHKIIEGEKPTELKKERRFPNIFGKPR